MLAKLGAVHAFFESMSTMVHEYGGHGFDNFALDNKNSVRFKGKKYQSSIKSLYLSYKKPPIHKDIRRELDNQLYLRDTTETTSRYLEKKTIKTLKKPFLKKVKESK